MSGEALITGKGYYMNPIAEELNVKLEGTVAGRVLSDFGTRFYFPRGIISQSAEAKKKAHRFNATVGMATRGRAPLYLQSIKKLIPGLGEGDVFPYAPGGGDADLRTAWRREMEEKNPSLRGKTTSTPLVTSGLTHGMMLAGDLFMNKGEEVVVPDMFWGNYKLIFAERLGGSIRTFPFYSEEGGFNVEAFEEALRACKGSKKFFILNFPNNPTGYSPTAEEAQRIVEVVRSLAEEGNDVVAVTDDAYFGLFYEQETCKESLFGRFADLHERVLAIKTDGATKEELAWGFRIGFITYASKGLGEEALEALENKTMGAIRSSISNANRMAQSLILRALKDPNYESEKAEAYTILESRYRRTKKVVESFPEDSPLQALPFNSGYFMTFSYSGDAEKLRQHLLDRYGIGTISIQNAYLRVAYSSVELEDIEELLTTIEQASREVLE
jgi:aspartate/methionine/tyrosine aminotransferase